ncbi:MAG: aminoacetone oxidase family FAD-binding enzyme [Bacteroidales bacterium]|jgi:predicted Rossmann fold flavoprotein|nr:aminoacetone oxidase family FAD-binding enzyme [Bacteroidales bacterium]
MKEFDIVVAGAGASGLMASIAAAEMGMKVLLLEKMERPGRKILITGKGRCNITNTKDWDEFSKHVYPNSNFFKTAFKSFSNKSLIDFFNKSGLETSVERGDRVYPLSGKSQDVVFALLNRISELGVQLEINSKLCDSTVRNGRIVEIKYDSPKGLTVIKTSALIISTGGLSYPLTGSTGDGFIFAEQNGITCTKTLPSLTALKPVNYNIDLQKLLLKNIQVKLVVGKDIVQEEFGDAEFTNNGFEGPIGLKISRKAVKALSEGNKVSLIIDLKPSLSFSQLVNRIDREFGDNDKIFLNALLKRLLPNQLISEFTDELKMGKSKILSKYLPGEINKIVELIKNWKIIISSYTGFERCVITAGGVSLNELIPKTLASRKVENLYFAGEVIDLDGDTGGYNLQIAFSTGHLAGRSAAYFIEKSRSLT